MNANDASYGYLLSLLAVNIKVARLKNNYRQADMIHFGFSERFIQKIESGIYSPNLYTIHRISNALTEPIEELFKKKSDVSITNELYRVKTTALDLLLYSMRNTEKNYSKLLSHLAQNVKDARIKKQLRQSDMIEFGFSERFIQKIESGVYSPNLYTVHRLAEAFDIPVDKLFKNNSAIK